MISISETFEIINISYNSNKSFLNFIEILSDLWNLTQTFNGTALIYTANKGNKVIFELLLRQEGIDINIQYIWNQKHSGKSNPSFVLYWKLECFHKTANDYAINNSCTEIVDLLSK